MGTIGVGVGGSIPTSHLVMLYQLLRLLMLFMSQ